MEFICGVDDDVKTQFDYLCNDTGVGTITLRQGSYAFSAVCDELYSGRYEALIVTVDPYGQPADCRWSGLLDNYELSVGAEGMTELKLTFLNDFEYIKRTIVPNLSVLPTFWPFQPQKKWIAGPSSWLVAFCCGLGMFAGFSGYSNVWQRFKTLFSPERGHMNAYSVIEGLTQFIFREQRDYYIQAPTFIESLSTGARWREVEGDYSSIYGMIKDIINFDNVVVQVYRHLEGDETIDRAHDLKHGCIVVKVDRKLLPSRSIQMNGLVTDTGNAEGSGLVSNVFGSLWFTGREIIEGVLGLFLIHPNDDVVTVQLSRNYTGAIDGSLERLGDVKTYPSVVFESHMDTQEVTALKLSQSTPKSVSVFTKGKVGSVLNLFYAFLRLVYDTIGQLVFLIPLGSLIVDLIEPVLQRISNPRPRWNFTDRKYYYSPTLYPTAFQPLDGMLFGIQQASNRRKAYMDTSEASSHDFNVSNSPFVPFWHFGLGTSVGCEIILDRQVESNRLIDGHLWLGRVSSIKVATPAGGKGIYQVSVKTDSSKRGRDFNAMMVNQVNIMTRALKRALLL